MTGYYYAPGCWRAFTLSENEVIKAIKGEKNLPYRGMTGFMRYKRHDNAIERLKSYGVVYKDDQNILQLHVEKIIHREP